MKFKKYSKATQKLLTSHDVIIKYRLIVKFLLYIYSSGET